MYTNVVWHLFKTMTELDKIEKTRDIKLPKLYRTFYERASRQIPSKLIGTDLLEITDFPDYANELLKENDVDNFLEKDDFIFMFHQGYIFWFFKADGTTDPMVFGYSEAEKNKRELKKLSEFMSEFE
jgi:hypothetical protein